ncbi:MAG: DUF305 domain-containing protein [Blastocatellia bacterium]|nr:DUF305 domain-containing protein [Blastocatellia bacterium]
MQHSMWLRLAVMTVVGFVAMYLLMFTMIDSGGDFFQNLNMAYMAGSMTAAMVVIELIVMSVMYKNAKLRNILIGVSAVLLVVTVLFTRYQTAIYDEGFLRSMIPHHSGAILMCENPKLEDPEILQLCKEIIESQKREISQMNRILERK